MGERIGLNARRHLGRWVPGVGRAEPAARRLSGGFPRSALALPSPVPRGVPSPCASRLLVALLSPSAMAQPSTDTFGSCHHLRVQNSEEWDPCAWSEVHARFTQAARSGPRPPSSSLPASSLCARSQTPAQSPAARRTRAVRGGQRRYCFPLSRAER